MFTVSEFSKKDISNYYNIPERNIFVIPNAVDEVFNDNAYMGAREITQPYFLGVSSPSYHKNFDRLVQSFNVFNKQYNYKYNLKIIGASNKSFNNISESNSGNGVHYLGRVQDDELKSLYKNAYAFIFPSLYEGFGIPPLEAQACGCAVLSSDAASLPEVLKDSAIYFNPNSIDDMVLAMNQFVSMTEEEKNSLRNKGKINYSRFSWFSSAKRISEVINYIT